jgi:quinolinate synthase
MYQIPLPEQYEKMDSSEAMDRIRLLKGQLGSRLVILGHHYQRDEIIQFADFTGDSLKLSQIAAGQKEAEYIVFCGVHFMAESADILTSEKQKVILPDLTAGCSMADMAEIDQVEECWQYLKKQIPSPKELIPVTYVNSSAAIKAFCGQRNGMCCTSSNCRAIFEANWQAMPQAVIMFLPDEHLGRNTAYRMGIPLEQMAIWDPYQPGGGIAEGSFSKNRVILWKGYCSVHQEFNLKQIRQTRAAEPNIKVIVHPECCFEVAQAADYVGSTDYIIKTIRAAQPGTSWAVGTEINLVNRLAGEMAATNVKVRSLSGTACLCETMYRINLPHLCWVLDKIAEHIENPAGVPLVNRIVVGEKIKQDARLALQRMLDITAAAQMAKPA